MVSSNLSGDDSLQLLTADYEPVSVQQAVTESSESFVSVGWGSRSTQFMGSAGKESREQELRTGGLEIIDDILSSRPNFNRTYRVDL